MEAATATTSRAAGEVRVDFSAHESPRPSPRLPPAGGASVRLIVPTPTASAVARDDDDDDMNVNGDRRRLQPRRRTSSRLRKHVPPMAQPIRTCFILAMPWAAYAVLNTVFQDVRLPYMTSMGIGDFVPRFVPPLVSIILGPILGAASDRSLSKWGRRSIFIMFATAILTVSGLLFGSAQVLFPRYEGFTNVLFLLVTLGLLVFDVGLRARLMDEVSVEYQVHAQAALAFWAGVGAVLGNLLFRNTATTVVVADISGEDILKSFSFALGGILITATLGLWLRPEHPQDRPTFHPPLDRLAREAIDQIVYAPKLFRILCLVYFMQFFAWRSFRDEAYAWWARKVYNGCNDGADCTDERRIDFRDGQDTANLGLMCQNGLQMILCLIIMWAIPRDICQKLKRASIAGLSLGATALITAVIIDDAWLPATFAAFVTVVFYQMVVDIFPYSIVGIMGKEIQESTHGFNNNGLYIGVLTSFSAVSQLFVQIYGTESMAPLGTGNVMTLPCILFVAGIACTMAFNFAQHA